MYNEFYYTKIHVDEPTEKGKDPKITVLEGCSFPLDNVEETIALPDGRRAIILKGGHEETQISHIPAKNGKVIENRERRWTRREIYLTPEDAVRYRKVTERVVLIRGDMSMEGAVSPKLNQNELIKPAAENTVAEKNPE